MLLAGLSPCIQALLCNKGLGKQRTLPSVLPMLGNASCLPQPLWDNTAWILGIKPRNNFSFNSEFQSININSAPCIIRPLLAKSTLLYKTTFLFTMVSIYFYYILGKIPSLWLDSTRSHDQQYITIWTCRSILFHDIDLQVHISP